MPEICYFYGIKIFINYSEHNPPHFHAEYGEFSAEFDIQTLQIIDGDLPKRAKTLILEWADNHRMELMENWERARNMSDLKYIEPFM